MPNWCYNSLVITGNKKSLKKFKETAYTKYESGKGETLIDFEKFLPREKSEKEKVADKYQELFHKEQKKKLTKEDREELALMRIEYDKEELEYSGDDWYHWNISNWGTKWNTCEPALQQEENDKLRYSFDTAWSPPCGVILAMSKNFLDLKFELYYEEPGNAFCGDFICERGKVNLNETREYKGNEGEE